MTHLAFRRVCVAQPTDAVGLALDNPLSRGLQFAAYPVGPAAYEAVKGAMCTPVATPTSGVGFGGRTSKFANASSNYFTTTLTQTFNTVPFTLAVVCTPTVINQDRCPISLVNATGDRREAYIYGPNSGAKAVCSYNPDGTFVTVTGATSLVANRTYMLIGRQTNVSSRDIWVNGTIDGTSTTTAGSDAASGPWAKIRIGAWARPDDTIINGYDGGVSVALVWNRALTDSEAQALSANPWQVFKAQTRRHWVQPAVSAGGFKPYWASQRSSVIGGGMI